MHALSHIHIHIPRSDPQINPQTVPLITDYPGF